MPEYQNLFTRVQVRGPLHAGVPVAGTSIYPRGDKASYAWLLGLIGNAQIGPLYLGTLGVLSLLSGFIAIEIIGLNMWASVGWNPILFLRDLPWLALEPPAPAFGLHIPPLNQGGWWLMAGFFLTTSMVLWFFRVYRRARQLGLGTPYVISVS
jgi:photosynthetic reaction center M subunit